MSRLTTPPTVASVLGLTFIKPYRDPLQSGVFGKVIVKLNLVCKTVNFATFYFRLSGDSAV
jgi:hypothetical protein